MPTQAGRAGRERTAYDVGDVLERSRMWHQRARHVLAGPNTQRGERRWQTMIREAVGGGGRVLDVGCGDGSTARLALESGAEYVLGLEISERQLVDARKAEIPGRLEFRV